MSYTYTIEFSVYGKGVTRHVFYGPATRVETAMTKDEAIRAALDFAAERYPDRTFEVVSAQVSA